MSTQTASKTLNLTVTNNATTGSITLTGTTISGANSGDFSVTGGSCGASLAASSSCTYAVTFTPSIETAESGTLSIGVMEDPNGGPPAVSLSGTGLTPLKVLPATLAFGTIAGGHSSVNKTVTVYNYGGGGGLAKRNRERSQLRRLRGDGRELRVDADGRWRALHLPAEVHAQRQWSGKRHRRSQRSWRCDQPAQCEPQRNR